MKDWKKVWKFLVDEAIEGAYGNSTKMSYDDYLFGLVWKRGEEFISSLLTSERERVIRLVEGMKTASQVDEWEYDQVLDDIITKLKGEE